MQDVNRLMPTSYNV